MLLDALSFVVSAVFVFWIRRPEPPVEPHDEAAHGPKPSMREEIAVGLRYVTGHRWLRSIAATTGIVQLLRQRRGRDPHPVPGPGAGPWSPAAIGFAFSIGSVGVLVAALRHDRGNEAPRRGPDARRSAPSASACRVCRSRSRPTPCSSGPSPCRGSWAGSSASPGTSTRSRLRQAITPPRMQGKMNATMRFIVWGTMPVGAILGGSSAASSASTRRSRRRHRRALSRSSR